MTYNLRSSQEPLLSGLSPKKYNPRRMSDSSEDERPLLNHEHQQRVMLDQQNAMAQPGARPPGHDDPIAAVTFRQLDDHIRTVINTQRPWQGGQAAVEHHVRREMNDIQTEMNERLDPLTIAGGSITPTFFTGSSTDSPKTFLRKFNKYATYQNWDDGKKLRSLPMFLTGSAEIWYSELPLGALPRAFNEMEDLLLTTFENESAKLIGSQKFNLISQGKNESVDKFASRLTALADKYDITRDARRNQFLAGLKPQIKTQVLAQSPATLEEAISKSLLAETALSELPSVKPANESEAISFLQGQMSAVKALVSETINKQNGQNGSNDRYKDKDNKGNNGNRFQSNRNYNNNQRPRYNPHVAPVFIQQQPPVYQAPPQVYEQQPVFAPRQQSIYPPRQPNRPMRQQWQPQRQWTRYEQWQPRQQPWQPRQDYDRGNQRRQQQQQQTQAGTNTLYFKTQNANNFRCFKCGKIGHTQAQCWSRQDNTGSSNLN